MTQPTQQQTKSKKILAAIAGSYVCMAFAALVLTDVSARVASSAWPIDKYSSPNRSWIWWATDQFRKQQERPQVVLLGSSLMMAALHGGDATYFNAPQNVALHHKANYLEALLAQKTHEPVNTFAFAIGGQMVSDAYAITSTMLKGEHKPDTIVYGVAPRDFMDNMLASPASTETFRYMNRLGGLAEEALPARTTFWEKVEYGLERTSFLYDHRNDFVYLQNKYARSILASTLHIKDLDFVHAPFELRKIAMAQLPEDTGANEIMILPYNPARDKYEDNTPEYRSRYRSFNKKKFDTQLAFLDKLGNFCKQEGINLVLVNMPLTPANVQLMPPGLYDSYLASLQKACTTYGARMVDLNEPNTFQQNCFADSVHLNGHGGKLFFEQLADRLAGGSMLAVSRRSATK
jgi:hypothetical protein